MRGARSQGRGFDLSAGTATGPASGFRFTKREEEVSNLLCAGKSLAQTAEELGIGLNTVRTHLAHIFRKTGTERQGQLIALLNRTVVGKHKPHRGRTLIKPIPASRE